MYPTSHYGAHGSSSFQQSAQTGGYPAAQGASPYPPQQAPRAQASPRASLDERRPAPSVDPQYSGPPRLDPMYGPYLRFGGYDPATHTYSASVMMVIHQTPSPYPPHLHYYRRLQDDPQQVGPKVTLDKPLLLWSYTGYNFWRWDIRLQLAAAPEVVNYWVTCSDPASSPRVSHNFHLPSKAQKWHWGFHSCNGFHDTNDELAMGGIQLMWRDVLHVHGRDPIHVMFGGGDQLYCDDVWKARSLEQWTSIQDKPSRNAHPFSQNMINETFDFYFRQYTTHFGKEAFRDALASIPQVMIWDDHDIFDGWGSYPPELQNCPVFLGIYSVARRFYLLFQWHAGLDNYRELNQGWGLTGLSYMYMLGNSTAVVGLDSRGERTREQIIQPASWAAFAHQVARLPAGVRHVVVLATVPVVYPVVPGVEEAMQGLANTGVMSTGLYLFLQKTGLSHHIYSQFGEPELLDDLLDHWSAKCHEEEKKAFLRIMQDLAKARNLRFTLVSGDVHCASVACLQTMPKMDPKRDHRYMMQVISSAIGNVPPPEGVITSLTVSSRLVNHMKMVDTVTREKILRKFENDAILKAARNWCDVHERPLPEDRAGVHPSAWGHPSSDLVSSGPDDGALHFQLRVENRTNAQAPVRTYDVDVPRLELPPGSFSAGPLAAPLPLPAPLAMKYELERQRSGYGLEAALPVPPAATDGGRQASMSAPHEPSPRQPDMRSGRLPSSAADALSSELDGLNLRSGGSSSSLIYPNLPSPAPGRGGSQRLSPMPSGAGAAASAQGSFSSNDSRRQPSYSGGPPPPQTPGATPPPPPPVQNPGLPPGDYGRSSSSTVPAYPPMHAAQEPTAPSLPPRLDSQGHTAPPPPQQQRPAPSYPSYPSYPPAPAAAMAPPPSAPYGSHHYPAPYPGHPHGAAAPQPYPAGQPQAYYPPPPGAPYYPPHGGAPGAGYAPQQPGPYGAGPPPTQYPYGNYPGYS